MVTEIEVGGISLEVVRKAIKHVHLSVYPPTGRIRISAPERTSLETLRIFAISKLGWIRQQQTRLTAQERETPREFLDRESHYVWGRRYLLVSEEEKGTPSVELKHSKLVLHVRPGTWESGKRELLELWYRDQVRAESTPLIATWEKRMGVKSAKVFVQRMKTRWGGCSPETGNIRLNTDLAKKPRECLEYIVVHELAHLIEPTHNGRFQAIMDDHLPKWRHHRDLLNSLPLRHDQWEY